MTNAPPRTENFEVTDHEGRTHTFDGQLIGAASTERREHTSHIGDHADRGFRCYACRWAEAYIYVVDAGDPRRSQGRYCVVTVGASEVPNEVNFNRANFTDSALEVIELLTVRKRDRDPYMPGVNARTITQAAENDDDLYDAWVNRATV
jgi:hypothetical protein